MTLPMTKGYYNARASGAPITFGRSENGNTQIAVEFVIEDEEYAGETITWVGHFTDKTAERTIESLQIAGWQGEDVSELGDVPGSSVMPEAVSLTCEAEEYNGEHEPFGLADRRLLRRDKHREPTERTSHYRGDSLAGSVPVLDHRFSPLLGC